MNRIGATVVPSVRSLHGKAGVHFTLAHGGAGSEERRVRSDLNARRGGAVRARDRGGSGGQLHTLGYATVCAASGAASRKSVRVRLLRSPLSFSALMPGHVLGCPSPSSHVAHALIMALMLSPPLPVCLAHHAATSPGLREQGRVGRRRRSALRLLLALRERLGVADGREQQEGRGRGDDERLEEDWPAARTVARNLSGALCTERHWDLCTECARGSAGTVRVALGRASRSA